MDTEKCRSTNDVSGRSTITGMVLAVIVNGIGAALAAMLGNGRAELLQAVATRR